MDISSLVILVLVVAAAAGGYFFFMKKKTASAVVPPVVDTPVVTQPEPTPTPTTRPYGTGLTHINPDNDSVGLNPEGVQEFANGPSSFIDNPK